MTKCIDRYFEYVKKTNLTVIYELRVKAFFVYIFIFFDSLMNKFICLFFIIIFTNHLCQQNKIFYIFERSLKILIGVIKKEKKSTLKAKPKKPKKYKFLMRLSRKLHLRLLPQKQQKLTFLLLSNQLSCYLLTKASSEIIYDVIHKKIILISWTTHSIWRVLWVKKTTLYRCKLNALVVTLSTHL